MPVSYTHLDVYKRQVYFRAKVNASVRDNVLNTVNITTSIDDARGNFSDKMCIRDRYNCS